MIKYAYKSWSMQHEHVSHTVVTLINEVIVTQFVCIIMTEDHSLSSHTINMNHID